MATATGSADLPLVAGHPALDLVNSVEPRLPPGAGDPERDHLATPSDLLIWSGRAGLVTPEEAGADAAAWERDPGAGLRALHQAHAVREALYLVLQGRLTDRPPAADRAGDPVRVLQAAWVDAAARSDLRPADAGPGALRLHVGSRPGWCAQDRIAVEAVQLLTGVDLTPLRTCPLDEGGCGWLFLDRSRGHSRRWCTMADCGARAKARRLTERRRTARSAGRG